MELDVKVCGKSLSIPIEDPFHLDVNATAERIESFMTELGSQPQGLDFRGLLPKMIRGIAGCEDGCPADARRLVAKGHSNFKLEYIEGGILHAEAAAEDGTPVALKMFPDF